MKTNPVEQPVADPATVITIPRVAALGPKMYQLIKLGLDVHWRE